jgi:hypothetical protein
MILVNPFARSHPLHLQLEKVTATALKPPDDSHERTNTFVYFGCDILDILI